MPSWESQTNSAQEPRHHSRRERRGEGRRNFCNAAKRGLLQTSNQPACHGSFSPVDEASGPLEGEDIATSHWEDARHWMSIYVDLLEFKRGILDRIRRDLTKLPPVAQGAVETDVKIIESQMEGYQRRVELWSQRIRELHGLWLDPETRIVRYKDDESRLTVREFQLLRFLLDHPHRFFTVSQILGQAWTEPALFPEEVRNYVRRVRLALAELEIPCEIVNRPGRGYALEFRQDS